jgi:hypothetical protein
MLKAIALGAALALLATTISEAAESCGDRQPRKFDAAQKCAARSTAALSRAA